MSKQYTFSKTSINKFKYNSTWRNSINTEVMEKTTKKTGYKLHPTGKWVGFDRVFIALPEDVDTTRWDVRQKYNLW